MVIQPIKMLCLLELFFDSRKTYLSKDKNGLFDVNDGNNRKGGGRGDGNRERQYSNKHGITTCYRKRIIQ